MRTLTSDMERWLTAEPQRGFRRISLWAVLAASALIVADTLQLFIQIIDREVVSVPFFEGLGVNRLTAVVGLTVWLSGLAFLLWGPTRARLGWLAPLGAAFSGLLDRQTFSDILYLITVALFAHWWSAWLETRPSTAHLLGVPLRVLQIQISVVLLWTVFAKLNARFMSGAVLSVSFRGPIDAPDFLLERESLVALAIATVIAEGFLGVALWIGTLRKAALVTAGLFHLGIIAFFVPTLPLTAFALAMASGYVLFAGEPWAPTAEPIEITGRSSGSAEPGTPTGSVP